MFFDGEGKLFEELFGLVSWLFDLFGE